MFRSSSWYSPVLRDWLQVSDWCPTPPVNEEKRVIIDWVLCWEEWWDLERIGFPGITAR